MAQLPKIDAEVEQILAETIDALFQRVRNSPSGVNEVIWEYLDALENDIHGTRAAVKGYTVVLAATCQQAASKQMRDMKLSGAALRQLNELDRRMVFNDVIVDEAARANPLDLFVPIALAERRIVLVGDHRQLPHILEPDVERDIERSIREETRELLKKSLFERLFTQLRQREERDGIKRTITVNKQFRMHPVLGKFVSETFYRPHGEEFESPRNTGQFEHNLDGYAGRVAAWINVAGAEGYEVGGQSKRRRIEARRVAAEASRLLTQRPDLSIGVITFYAAQRNELMGALVELGIAEKTEGGGYEIREAWRETSGTRKERLRVGTVDAFQGKEFDIVLLSITRSNDIQATDERSFRRKYGHLMLENRVCVAMSRQQRLLIAVGDSGMLNGAGAATAVPGLVKFYELCGGPNGIRL
jgi:superfamily I DNA and/or RNA helicase